MNYDFIANTLNTSPLDALAAAEKWASGSKPPSLSLELNLARSINPATLSFAEARNGLWRILSYPERARALAWLGRVNLLEKMLPVWAGNLYRQRYRLAAAEELHLERWAEGLSQEAFDKICEEMGVVLDGGINRWALTGLGILLAEGDLGSKNHSDSVRNNLSALEVAAAEMELIMTIVQEYSAVGRVLSGQKSFERKFSIPSILCGLTSVFADSYTRQEEHLYAVSTADNLMKKYYE